MAGANMDQFEAFFKRADLDGDGRISGAEAVSFFQGASLPKPVLAQIWTYADQNRSGFLGGQEFFNALRLVTVAQSKRDLTPDIVKAALYGPAAAKIPAPKINLPSTPAPLANQRPSSQSQPPQVGVLAPTAAPQLGFSGPGVPNATMNPNYFPPQKGQLMRPPQTIPGTSPRAPAQSFPGPDVSRGGSMLGQSQARPAGIDPHPPQYVPGSTVGSNLSKINVSTGWSSGGGSGLSPVSRGVGSSASPVTPQLQPQTAVSLQPTTTDSKALVVSGNGLTGDPFFSNSMFSPTKQQPTRTAFSATSAPASSAIVPVSTGSQPSYKSNTIDSIQSAFTRQPLGSQPPRAQSLPSIGQQASASPALVRIPGVGNSSSTPQPSWPKMKTTDVQKYTKVFMEVDTDRDGRITGEQARNLFLSWRLPREILKQVWDLADQDSDSMLSLREFCFALYLMERYREGHPLPAALPSTIMYDETLLSMTGQSKTPYGPTGWGASPGFGQQPGFGPRPMGSVTGLRQPAPVSGRPPAPPVTANQQKTGGPVMEDQYLNQHGKGDQSPENSMPQDGELAEKKVEGPENLILDSREKLEFYRNKMQELVFYKSRCENRLNEITERALADKREAEMLGKKYEEKYKQVAEVASKLTIEEASYRDAQERKMELQQAIINVEKGGSVDGILQVRADRIHSDLDELLKALTERCKRHGLEIKSAAVIELPKGWQPGIQEDAAVWDEEWDKFEDEGFSNELAFDAKNPSVSPKQNGSLTRDSLSNDDEKGNIFNTSEHAFDSGSAKSHSEDEFGKSPQGSPARKTTLENPTQDFSDVFARSSEADTETHIGFDDSWGVFDGNDDADSVWGFNAAKQELSDSGRQRDFFEYNDFGVNSVRADSLTAESPFQKKSVFFEKSVAGSPRYSEAGDHFDSFSRFDSFSVTEGGLSPQHEKFTRFDSISSSKDFGDNTSDSGALFSYDDADAFGSSGPFKVSSNSQSPKKSSESNWSSF